MQSDEQAIRTFIATWMDATRTGDTETVLGLIADDAVFLVTGQPPMVGKAAFAAAQSKLQGARIEPASEIREIRVLGDWAYLWTALSVVITHGKGGTPVKRAGHTLSILQKRAGQWVLVRDANMLAPVP
jgi:uncharacterized protein (TIGR02246 family)